MANCNEQFLDFDETIKLNDSRVRDLKRTRKRLRKDIRKDFKENHKDEIKPKFWGQGSFKVGTSVNPIPKEVIKDGKKKTLLVYDVDDGIYFIGNENEKKDIAVYHNWIYNAVKGHTDQDPIDKSTCVRTVFSDGHHIDQPIYYEVNNKVPQLAHKSKGWIYSDPRDFCNWIENKAENNNQLKRLIRYFKSWCDVVNHTEGSKKMPSGLVMTIWVCENAVFNERDDIAMEGTLGKIKLLTDSQASLSCIRPTTPKGENLLEDYAYHAFFKSKLSKFVESAMQAIRENNPKRACAKWQMHFGTRFSCSTAKDIDENAKTFPSRAIITENAKSA